MTWTLILSLGVALALPPVLEITPPAGGLVLDWLSDYSACLGVDNRDRPFIWTEATGPIYLEHCVSNWPGSIETYPPPQLLINRTASQYVIRYASTAPDWLWHWYIIHLPLDLASLFSPADFDYDGDVDQSDFGLWQRAPDRMPLSDFLKQMGGPR